MKPWMLPWLLPVALIAGVLIVVVFSANEALAAAVAGVLLLPLLWRLYSPRRGEHNDTDYWRLPRRWR